jgi:hypothetical protein
MGTCELCGGQADDLAMHLTIEVAAGRRGPRRNTELPTRLEGATVCWACLRLPASKSLAFLLASEYMEPVIPPAVPACHATCTSGRVMGKLRRRGIRRVFSLHQGSLGTPEQYGRCPVCLGPCQVERTA